MPAKSATTSGLEVQRLNLPDADVRILPAVLPVPDCASVLAALQAQIAWRQEYLQLYGRRIAVPRLSAWHGDVGATYRYSGLSLQPARWTDLLQMLRNHVETASGEAFNSVLLNLYRDGRDCVHWHCDNEAELGDDPVIASLSFGAVREFQLRHVAYRDNGVAVQTLRLDEGSVLLMRGATQRYWQHRVPRLPASRQCGPRVNLSFRTICHLR